MPDTTQAINEIYQDQKSSAKTPSGNDPGENGAQRPLNIVPPETEENTSPDSGTEAAKKGKQP